MRLKSRHVDSGEREMVGTDSMRKTVLLTGCLAVFLSVFASSMLNIALPSIMDTFRLSQAVAVWAIASYLLCYALLMPVTGIISDRWGRRKVYIVGMWLFLLGTTLAATSPLFALLIFARCLQGIGAAAMFPPATAMIREMFAFQSGRAMGFVTASASVGMLLGPPVSGYLLEMGDYRGIFLVILPVAGLLLVMGSLTICDQTFDKQYNSLQSDNVVKLLPFYKEPPFVAIIVIVVCQNFIASSICITFPLMFIRDFHLSPSQAGNLFLMFPLSFLVASPLGGYLADKNGYRVPVTLGSLLLVAALVLLSVGPAHTVPLVTALFAVMGLAFGLSLSPLSLGSMEHASAKDIAKASGLFGFFRQSSGSAGIVITPFFESSSPVFAYLAVLLVLGLILFVALNHSELYARGNVP